MKHSSLKRKEAKEIKDKNIIINKLEELKEKKERSDTISHKHMEGVMIRSCPRWIEHGERQAASSATSRRETFSQRG